VSGHTESRLGFWRAVFAEHGAAVLAYLRLRLRRREDAEDLLHETFMWAIRAGEALREDEKVRVVQSGTNDVNDDICGIRVEDARFGRVKVLWDAFRRLDFTPAPSSGPGHESFGKARQLRGTVRASSGKTLHGRLVFDLDEAETWELLDGSQGGVDYSIPFAMVAAIAPENRHGALVTLKNGTVLHLEDSHDVSNDNAGMLIFTGPESQPTHLAWKEVASVELE
jgi:hypothetical protein